MPPFRPFMPGMNRLTMIPGTILLQVAPPSIDTVTPARPAFGSFCPPPPAVNNAPPKYIVLSFAIATHGALQPHNKGSPLPPGVRRTLIMFRSAKDFPPSFEIDTRSEERRV